MKKPFILAIFILGSFWGKAWAQLRVGVAPVQGNAKYPLVMSGLRPILIADLEQTGSFKVSEVQGSPDQLSTQNLTTFAPNSLVDVILIIQFIDGNPKSTINIRGYDTQAGYNLGSRSFQAAYSDARIMQDQLVESAMDILRTPLASQTKSDLDKVHTGKVGAIQAMGEADVAIREKRYVDAFEGFAKSRAIDPLFRAPKQQLETRSKDFIGKLTDPSDIGRAYAYTGDIEKSKAAYEQALQKTPDNIAALVGQGDLLMQMNKPADALSRYERAMRLDPKNALAAVGLASAFHALGRTAEAQQALEKAKTLGSTDPEVFEKLGALYASHRNTKAATEAYQTAGELAQRSSDFNKAQKYFSEMNRLAPTATSMEKEAEMYIASGEFLIAVNILTKALLIDSSRDSLWSKLGYAFYLNQQPTEAIKRFRKAYELNQTNYEACFYLGMLLVSNRQERAQAVKYLETAARLRPEDTQVQFMLAQAYIADNRIDAAVGILEKMIKLNPRNSQAHKELGEAYLATDDTARAENEFVRAIELAPDFKEAHESLAKLYIRMGRRKEAITEIEKVYLIDAADNIFVTEGQDLLSSLVPVEMISLVRKFPKTVAGHFSINQVGVLRVTEDGSGKFQRVWDKLFTFYKLDDFKIREDFEIALLVQYLSISPNILSKNVSVNISKTDFNIDSLLQSALGQTRLDGLFGLEIPSANRMGEKTEVTLQPTLFSGADRSRFPTPGSAPISATVFYPTSQIMHFNTLALINLLIFLGLLTIPTTFFQAAKFKAVGKGALRIIVNYDPKLESFLTLKLSKKQEEQKSSSSLIVRDKEKYERSKFKQLLKQKGAWVRQMVGRETLFQGLRSRPYYVYLYGTIEDSQVSKKTIGNYYMVQRTTVRKNETTELVFQLEKEEAFVTIFVTYGEKEVVGAEVRVPGDPEPKFSRGNAGAFIYLKKGRHKILISHEGRKIEKTIDIHNFDDKIINVDLQTEEEATTSLMAGRSVETVAEEFKKEGKLEEAAEVLEKAGKTGSARETRAEAFTQEGNLEGAAEEYIKAKDFWKAAEIYRSLGKTEKSDYFYGIHAYQQEDYNKALEYLKNTDQHSILARIYEKLGDKKSTQLETARAFLKKGQKLEAAQAFVQAEAYADAADLYESLGDLAKAAVLHAKDGNFSLAGELFSRGGDQKKAALAFEKGGLLDQAAAVYKELGEMDKVVDLMERQGKFLEAAGVFRQQGLLDEGIAMCQKVPSYNNDFPLTQTLLANMFAEKGVEDLAIKTFAEAFVSNGGVLDLDSSYVYASLLEKKGDYKKALDLFEDIQKKDFHFKDVGHKIEDLQKKAKTKNALKVTETVSGPALSKPLRYEVIEEVGRGAMGVVYKAKDKMLDRIVAFKTLPHTLKDDAAALDSLMKEAQTAAKLNHPNIVTIFDVGQEGENYFMAMEYVEGKTLQQVLKAVRKVNVPNFMHVAKALCDVIGYAHENRVIHRDIKPSNIILLPNKTVKLMDFGLAKVLQDMSIDKTMLRGTPLYMSPEQVLGKDIDHRTDLYSLGILFYEMLAGRTPFTQGDIMYAHLHTPPPELKDLVQGVPEGVIQAIMACLAKDKAQRPKTAKELSQQLGIS